MCIVCITSVCADEQSETYSPSANKVEKSYTTKIKEKKGDENWSAAWTELGGYMLLGAGLYSIEEESMKLDWDYEIEDGFLNHTWERFTTKDAWKFDNNDFTMNWGHTYAGALYHNAYRNNGLSFYQSLAGPIVGSLIWEGVIEYKEVVSINDHITTMFGGAFLGEVFFQTGEMLKRKQSRTAHILAAMLNPSLSVQNWFNNKGYNAQYRNMYQALGFDTPGAEIFDLHLGTIQSNGTINADSRSITMLGITTKTENIPFTRQQSQSLWLNDPFITQLHFGFGFSSAGSERYDTQAKLVYAGHVNYDVNSHTHTRTIHGLWGGMDLHTMGKGDNEDAYGVVNLVGYRYEHDYRQADFRWVNTLDLSIDFAMVRPFTRNQALADQSTRWWSSKPVLWQDDYYYSFGHTSQFASILTMQAWSLEASIIHHDWDSIDNKEYERASIVENRFDLDLKDSRLKYKLGVGYSFGSAFKLLAFFETHKRDGKLIGIDNPNTFKSESDSEELIGLMLTMSI